MTALTEPDHSSSSAQHDVAAEGRPAIELVGVAKSFTSADENVQAVEQVDLAIGSGEFFSLLGPSGCGKTTTLRMIAGFEVPTSGQIMLYGEDVVAVPPNHRDINMVFQSYALFPHMSVFDNVAFGLRRRKVPDAQVRTRVGDMLDLVELAGREKRRPRELSGGQQQRVALARALVNHPRALLLDEPLGALDLKLRQAMQLELKRIQREVGITFVYVTHDQGEALTMSDRLAVMNAGRVEQVGTPRQVYERPASRFVAGFIGTSNTLTGRAGHQASSGDDAVLTVGDEQRIVVPAHGRSVASGAELVVTVRPEKITIGDPPSGSECRVRGTVREVVYQGTFTSYTVAAATGDTVLVHRQNSDDSRDIAAVGDQVWMSWAKQHSYLIDEEPTERNAP
ncbi:MAG TPA: ABC transporter ATP-binding protein [Nocardioidaceae bacterium]|nr:ABC transporter ATP-binding protein [Nocardioidaceae bacterium]